MIDTAVVRAVAKLNDRDLLDQLQDTFINKHMVPAEDRPQLEEEYVYLKSEWDRRQATKERF